MDSTCPNCGESIASHEYEYMDDEADYGFDDTDAVCPHCGYVFES